MRSLECRIGLLNSHTHINRHAYVQKQRFVLCVFGSALSEAAGSPTVRLLLPTCAAGVRMSQPSCCEAAGPGNSVSVAIGGGGETAEFQLMTPV